MTRSELSWFAVICLCLGNLYLGRQLGLWGVPASIRGRRSIPAALFFGSLWVGGLFWLYRINGLQLTFVQACILSGAFLTAHSIVRREFGLKPKIPWVVRLNAQLNTITRICARHGWDLSSAESIRVLSTSSGIHFDGGDYDLLRKMMNDEEYEFEESMPSMVPRTANGSIEYDRACAREIVTMANMLRGHEGIPGMIHQISQMHDLSDLHWTTYKTLLKLADTIESQWEKETLWSSRDFSGGNLPTAKL